MTVKDLDSVVDRKKRAASDLDDDTIINERPIDRNAFALLLEMDTSQPDPGFASRGKCFRAPVTGIDVCEGKKCRNNFRSNLIISLGRVQDLINWS